MSDIKVNEIKTDTIKNQAGTTVMTIDNSGRILTPARPAWSCHLSTSQNSQNVTTSRPVPFDTEDFDIGGNLTVDITNGGVFTAPVSGIYQFNSMCQWASVQGGAYVDLYMYVDDAQVTNGNLSYRHIEDPEGGQYHTSNNSSVIQLTAGQTLTPYIMINGDTNVNIRSGCRFNGFLVG